MKKDYEDLDEFKLSEITLDDDEVEIDEDNSEMSFDAFMNKQFDIMGSIALAFVMTFCFVLYLPIFLISTTIFSLYKLIKSFK